LAKEIIAYLIDEKESKFNIAGVWADEPFNNPRYNEFYKGDLSLARSHLASGDALLLAIASPKSKRAILDKLGGPEAYQWVTYIHSTATVSSFSTIGRGCIITPQCIVTSDACLGDFVFMNTGSVVGHDSVIGEYSTLFPNTEVCGDCILGSDCVLGIGAFVVPGVHLQPSTRVRAGSVVWESQKESALLGGNPAIPIVR